MVLPGVCPKADDVDIFFSGLQLLWFLDKVRLAWVGLMVSTIMNYSGMPADHSFSFFFCLLSRKLMLFFLTGLWKKKSFKSFTAQVDALVLFQTPTASYPVTGACGLSKVKAEQKEEELLGGRKIKYSILLFWIKKSNASEGRLSIYIQFFSFIHYIKFLIIGQCNQQF